MASVDFGIDQDVVKAMRASHRATDLHMKRKEYRRARDARDWTWGRAVEETKPHRNARVAVRARLAKGAIETQEDMPSIVRMHTWKHEQAGKAPHRKPAIAAIMTYTTDVDAKAVSAAMPIEEAETTADEGYDGSEAESPESSPELGPQEPPQELTSELAAWPALAGDLPEALAAAEEKASHKEVALRFVKERVEEQAALDRRRAKKAQAARAARAASAWRTALRRRRQRSQASRTAAGHAEARPSPAVASDEIEVDHDALKMMRAASRHNKLYMKRREYARARDARDWTWGRAVEEAKPHRNARVAVRTCLARGAVETQEDMPSIVCMASKGKHERAGKAPQRKPAIAALVHYAAEAELRPDVGESSAAADEGCMGFALEPAAEVPLAASKSRATEPAPKVDSWPALERSSAPEAPEKKRGSCVIC